MSEAVDRVARAMKERAVARLETLDSLDRDLAGAVGNGWQYLARTAILELRDNPTKEMQAILETYLLTPYTDPRELAQQSPKIIWDILNTALAD